LLFAVYQYRLGRIRASMNMRFEERLAERTRIAQELHDTLLQGFLSASMQLQVAADLLPDDSKSRPLVARTLQLMQQVIEEGRNTVRGLRAAGSSGVTLETALSQIKREIDPDSRVNFQLVVEGRRRELHPMLQDEVYRIGREALINAFRHAHARNIEVELNFASDSFRLFVRDDGGGIDPAVLQNGREGHWGLVGMRERAERIGAQIHVFSRASAGTEIEVDVPANVAFSGASKSPES
jgi:signal transduction histidine kinase